MGALASSDVELPGRREDASFDFVIELLAELRATSFHPRGWLRFLGRSWRQSQGTARTHPSLTRSWAASSAVVGAALTGALLAETRAGHAAYTRTRTVPLAAAGFGYAVFDVYVHLGMNSRERGLPLYPVLGWANALTLARSAVASLLWARLLAGESEAGISSALLALAAAGTDVADGVVARRLDQTSRLGQYLDSVADFSLWLALGSWLLRQHRIPRWLGGLLLVRWVAPMAFAFGRYFGVGRRLPIGSTRIGKAAGVAQALVVLCALLPDGPRHRIQRLLPTLYAGCAVLLVAAPVSQFAKLRRAGV